MQKELDSSQRRTSTFEKVGKQRLYYVSYVGNIGTQNIFDEGMIMEGAYGHMNHPFDTEMNLTFGDLKTIISKSSRRNIRVYKRENRWTGISNLIS